MYIRDRILTVHNGSRIDARRVLFLFLSKEPQVGIDLVHEAEALRSDGVEVFVLFIGSEEELKERLLSVASQPTKSHFFRVDTMVDLGFLGYLAHLEGEASHSLVFKHVHSPNLLKRKV